jgi:AcrR family transcriptional regulator
MKIQLQIEMNEKLFLKNPIGSDLGRKIVQYSIELINKSGFENFTFKKLSKIIGTSEAAIYRYFENKHRLLIYLSAWYWNWLEFQVSYQTNNIDDPRRKLEIITELLGKNCKAQFTSDYVDMEQLHEIVINEGSKTYLSRSVSQDNNDQLFKPYKDLCAVIADIALEFNPSYKYPKSLASTIIEISHFQNFFMNNLPALTDFGTSKDEDEIVSYLNHFVFSCLK